MNQIKTKKTVVSIAGGAWVEVVEATDAADAADAALSVAALAVRAKVAATEAAAMVPAMVRATAVGWCGSI